MKYFVIKLALFFATLVSTTSCSAPSNAAPLPLYPIPTAEQLNWHKLETYACVHFSLNTFNDMEWGYGDSDPSLFNPSNLDANQWVEIIKAAGFKGLILTAKHHDGFCLWPSKYTQYSIEKSPYKNGKGDLVKEVADACHKAGLKFGIYLSPWDRNRADYGQDSYVDYYYNQLQELYDNYTNDIDIFEQWFDGANGGEGYYGGAKDNRTIDPTTYYRYDKAVDMLRQKFPAAMIFGGTCPTIRLVANDDGVASETNWNMTSKILERETSGAIDGQMWLPAECDVSIRPGWFYHPKEDTLVKSVENLMDIYYSSVGRGAVMLLNFPIDKTGRINAIDSARIMEWRAAVDNDLAQNLARNVKITASNERGDNFKVTNLIDEIYDTYWATADGVNTANIEINFRKPTTFNRILLQEYIALGQRVDSFSMDSFEGGQWRAISTTDSMTTIGYKRILRTEPITTERVRVNILSSRGEVVLNNVEIYLAPQNL